MGQASDSIETIRRALAGYRPAVCEAPGCARAAVALVLRERAQGVEFLAIHRAHRPGDPWSGHMALPGGRQQPADADLRSTAARETREEVGLDLERDGEALGTLDELQAVGNRRLLDLVIRPFVYVTAGPVAVTPSPHEVQGAYWIPLASLRRPEARGTFRPYGPDRDFPAFLYRGHTIWGLTHRILWNFLEVLDRHASPAADP